MRGVVARALGAVCLLAVSACATMPMRALEARDVEGREGASSTEVEAVLHQMICEVDAARDQHSGLSPYYVSFSLTMKVDDVGALTPSVTDINPLSQPSTSETLGVGATVRRSRSRSFTQNGYFMVGAVRPERCGRELRREPQKTGAAPPAPPPPPPLTSDPRNGLAERRAGEGRAGVTSLSGNLGITDVVDSGLRAVSMMPGGGKQGADNGRSFGSTITFTLENGINLSPGVTRVGFRGYGGQNGLLGISNTETNTLVITFGETAREAEALRSEITLQNAVRTP